MDTLDCLPSCCPTNSVKALKGHLEYVATLQVINDKSHDTVATYLRCGWIVISEHIRFSHFSFSLFHF